MQSSSLLKSTLPAPNPGKALFAAVKNKNILAAKGLLEEGMSEKEIEYDIRDGAHYTSLYQAILNLKHADNPTEQEDSLAMIKLLLIHKAKLTIDGGSADQIRIISKSAPKALDILLEATISNPEEALKLFCSFNNFSFIKKILENKEIYQINSHNLTEILYAEVLGLSPWLPKLANNNNFLNTIFLFLFHGAYLNYEKEAEVKILNDALKRHPEVYNEVFKKLNIQLEKEFPNLSSDVVSIVGAYCFFPLLKKSNKKKHVLVLPQSPSKGRKHVLVLPRSPSKGLSL